MTNTFKPIDKSWTIFLDRDGVINRRPVGDYVKTWEEFDFLPGVLEAIKIFSQLFGKVIVVTNQQGIGKNIMSTESLNKVHEKMQAEINRGGGRIDKIYFCPDLRDKQNNCRKPGLAMAQKAKNDFNDIQFEKSIIAGDMPTDMQFGRNAGMKTIYINSNHKIINNLLIDAEYPDLISFAKSILANV